MLNAVIHLRGSNWRATSSGSLASTPAEGTHAATESSVAGDHATEGSTAHASGDAEHAGAAHTCEPASCSKDPGPIMPELKELAWGAGSFIVFALLMRFMIFPKLKRSMDARYQGIQNDHASADAARAAARSEVADYQAQVASIRAEGQQIVDAARNELEAERQSKLAEVNARLAQSRAAAQAEVDAARQAAKPQIAAAVSEVASRAGELATGRAPSSDTVNRVVAEVMSR